MAVNFRLKQAEFAAHIRDPANNPAPADVDPQRMAAYCELFFNNIDSSLSSTFPVLRQILDDAQWQSLTRSFYASHRCRTPHFSEIAEEFLEYLQTRNQAGDYPFMLELAHYEWVEMALAISRAQPLPGDAAFAHSVTDKAIALSPLAWPLAYQYPVQLISPAYLPLAAADQPVYLIVYRDQDDHVHFMQTTVLTFRLLQILEEHEGMSGNACLQMLAAEAQYLDPDRLLGEGLKILRDMAEKGIVIPAADD
ncbi:MAG: putative DNA-binding domain-containing protein [Methylococcales bacterium]|nr:putative DNA-binding domain-containing protein [Methylococcales bacterium]